ncbi:hypothetical protein ROZALSC1DRAFT_25781, partial [Rozella allomycis CSF55]
MGLYQDERDIVNGSEDENLSLNDDNVLLSDNVNLSYINENNLLEKFPDLDGPPSSYSTSRQSKKISEISNLPAPDSPLLNSSNSSDLDEVMLIDLPCPCSISNSSSISNLKLTNNQLLPCQVDASTSSSTLDISLAPSISKVKKNKSLQGTSKSMSKRISKPKDSKSSKSILSYFKQFTKSKPEEVEDLIEIVCDGNNFKETESISWNHSSINSANYSKMNSKNNLHKRGNNSLESPVQSKMSKAVNFKLSMDPKSKSNSKNDLLVVEDGNNSFEIVPRHGNETTSTHSSKSSFQSINNRINVLQEKGNNSCEMFPEPVNAVEKSNPFSGFRKSMPFSSSSNRSKIQSKLSKNKEELLYHKKGNDSPEKFQPSLESHSTSANDFK